jgi:hypothetical protein
MNALILLKILFEAFPWALASYCSDLKSVSWLVGQLVGKIVGQSIGQSVSWFVGQLVGWSVSELVGQ